MLQEAKIIRHKNSGQHLEHFAHFRTEMKTRVHHKKSVASGIVQQLPLTVPAAAEDLRPLVEAGGGGGEHDHIFLLQAQPAHPRGRVEGARP